MTQEQQNRALVERFWHAVYVLRDYDAVGRFFTEDGLYQDVSADGLWRGSELLEQQGLKKKPVMLPAERKKYLDSKKKPAAAEPAKPADPKAPKDAAGVPAKEDKAATAKK